MAQPSGWEVVRLADLLEVKRAISYGIVQPGSMHASGVPIVRVTDVRNGRISSNTPLRVAPGVEANYARTRLQGGELLLTLVGTVGESAVVPRELKGWNVARAVAVIPVRRDIGARWVHWILQSPAAKTFIADRVNTTVQTTLNLRDVAELPVPMPPIEEQRAIASVLGALDDKIELNRRMNETLEALARAIFTSWFVDFDPVRARAEGRQPVGMDAETAALFPGSFEDSPLGPIPSGWQVGTLAELVSFSRQSLDPADYPVETFDHYSIPAFDDGRSSRGEVGASIKSSKFLVPAGAVLLSKLNPRIPRVWLPGDDGERRSIASTEFLVSVPIESAWREWVFCLYQIRAFRESIAGLVTGTSGSHQRARPHDVLAYRFALPPMGSVAAFSAWAGALVTRVAANQEESVTLAAIRDAVLPGLISGETRVRPADKLEQTF